MSSRRSGELWRRVSPHLDAALERDGAERQAWLAELRQGDPELAAEVEALLASHEALRGEGFLEADAGTPPADGSLAGQLVGAYTVRRLLGQGGMGNVWLADRSDGRFEGVAAVKLLNPSLLGRLGEERFRREGTILARLRHRHIAQLIDAGVTPLGQPYLVLEHVDGQRVDRYCNDHRLDVEARIRLFLEVLDAVAHAHAHLVVHRDLKPSNVLVTAAGEVKLLDFGIAKLMEAEGAESEPELTRDGEVALTPEYAAPEQLTDAEITTATDVYSLGVLLYTLLTGQHPAHGGGRRTPADLILAIIETAVPRPSDAVVTTRPPPSLGLADAAAQRASTPARLRRRLRGDLDAILARALEKEPQRRYPSAQALADDLRRHLGHEPVAARPAFLSYRAGRFVRRHRTAVALAGLVVAALAAGMVGTLSQARRARAQAAVAQTQRARADQAAAMAAAQRDFALRQVSRAEAINDLNSFLLSDAAPLGRPFTAGDLLARAERVVERQTADDPDDRVELLISIGRQQQMLDAHDDARRLLGRAYELAGRAVEPATRAKAACALASAVALAGENERAERLIAEAEAALPARRELVLHRLFCTMRASEVAQDRGDSDVGLQRAEAARGFLEQSGASSATLELRVAMKLAESYRLLGRNRESASAFATAFARLQALGRDDTDTAGTLLNNWGLALSALGQPLAAERLFRRAIEISSADGSDANVSPMLLNNYARALRDLGRLEEATADAERAYAQARQAGHHVLVFQNLLLRASLYRMNGDLDRTARTLAELEPILKRMVPAGNTAYAALAIEQGLLAAARGDFAAALAAADRGIAITEASPQRDAYLSRFLLRRAEIAMDANQPARARADAERALRETAAAASPGEPSSNLGATYLVLGRALAAEGKTAEARRAYASALAQLAPALGERHPTTRRARALAGR